jgi:osmotically-inducible protein OsmY
MRKFTIGALLGGFAAFLFDPQDGRRRRHMARDRAAAFGRRGFRRSVGAGRAVSSEVYGVAKKVQHARPEQKPQPDDVTLARKVETEIFRDPDVPKGKIDVNAENGVVFLRGQAERAELIQDLEAQVRKIPGVQGVENLLHTPGEPAPSAPGATESS